MTTAIVTSILTSVSAAIVYLLWPGVLFEIGYRDGKFRALPVKKQYTLSIVLIHLAIIMVAVFLFTLIIVCRLHATLPEAIQKK